MNKAIALCAISLFAIVLGLSSMAQDAIADSKAGKQNQQNNKIQEFSNGTLMSTSSTTTICHMPPGNPDNSRTLVVNTSSLTAHLNHGDTIGNCEV